MIGVGGEAVAGQLGEDVRAALLGVLEFLDDDDAGAFAHDEAVAVLVEGPRGAFRLVVAGAQRAAWRRNRSCPAARRRPRCRRRG